LNIPVGRQRFDRIAPPIVTIDMQRPAMAQSGHIKRPPRIDVLLAAVLIDSDGLEAEVLILELSSGGFRLQVKESPQVGELVTLRVEHGREFAGRIRWALGTEAGGVFLEPVLYPNLE
jgi:hypothetical protein